MSLPYALAETNITGDEVGNAVRDKLMAAVKEESGASSTETKNTVQMMNTARQKKEPPQVAITFTPTNPTPGEKVTASAIATYFMNDPNVQYYTWYLQHNTGKPDATDSEGHKTKDGNTDWNNDKRIDVEDYKIEAMRLIANGGFDWQQALGKDAPLCKDASVSADQKPAYCTLDNQYKNKTGDDDSYKAVIGGDDQRSTPSKNEHCYLHNFSSGNEYEFPSCEHLFPNAPGETTAGGDNRFSLKEEEFWRTNPASKDTAGSGTVDEAAVAGLGKFTFNWNYATGDKVGVVVEGISVEATGYQDSSYMTMWALPKNMCTADPEKTKREEAPSVVTEDPTYHLTSPLETTPILDSATGLPKLDPITHEATYVNVYYKSVNETVYTKTYSDGPYVIADHGTGPAEIVTITVSTQTKHYKEDKTKVFAESLDGSGYTYLSDSYETVNKTEHPELIGYKKSDGTYATYTTQELADNPALSAATQTGKIFTASKGVQSINDCLMANILEPSEGAAAQKMEINLSYFPNAPVNSIGDNADQLNINSSIVSEGNKDFLNYAWQIYLSSDIAATDKDWHLLTLPETGVKKLSGIGLDSLQMKLNFTEQFLREAKAIASENPNLFYAKVVLKAVDGVGAKKKEGVGTVIIPIQMSANSLQIFSTTVSDTLAVSLDTTTERCVTAPDENNLDAITCPVAKNEIMGAKFIVEPDKLKDYEFLWSFDNKPIAETDKNIAYFPILAERNTPHTLSLNVANTVTGEKTSLIKNFKVTDPAIALKSVNLSTCAPTLLGFYVDPINANPDHEKDGVNENMWPDLSDNLFEALTGETIEIKPTLNPLFHKNEAWFLNGEPIANSGYENKTWFFDGVPVTPANMADLGITEIKDDGTLVFVAEKPTGEKYNITFGSLYTQTNLVKRALNATWEVPQTAFYEKNVSQSIEIQMTDTLSGSRVIGKARTPQQKIMASLFSAIPSYINFLFRVILTMGLILFLVRTMFSLFPKQNRV
ncbi:MAG: hypothetical protein Q7T51_01145 [Candidatus Moranbacteria bacterium]|nr:hypothetical protein [Candidatus Moranbacteria bacterium]